MLATVVVTVWTHNLAFGVLTGVLLSGVFFAAKISQIFRVTNAASADGRSRVYRVEGQLFYASVEDFNRAFDFREALDEVTIDVLKFRREGTRVALVGMNAASETIVDTLAVHDKPGAMDQLKSH
jgi:SulP family sulfate permease